MLAPVVMCGIVTPSPPPTAASGNGLPNPTATQLENPTP